MVIWLIGLSGTGKSTIGREVYRQWRETDINTVFVDGDEIRAVFKHDNAEKDYSIEGRRVNAERIQQICAWLDNQDINVVCCILSIFNDITHWNREHLKQYYEVFIDVPMETLRERDIKNLYAPAYAGEVDNVVGVDIPFSKPESPDITLDNSDSKTDFSSIATKILESAKSKYA